MNLFSYMSLIKIPIGTSIAYQNFNGRQLFQLKTPSLKWIIPYKSYMVMRVRVTQIAATSAAILPGLRPIINTVDADGHPVTVTIPYLNNNPITTFFTSLKTEIGIYEVTSDDNLPAGNTMYKIITRSKEEEERIEPNNKISYISLNEAYTAPLSNIIPNGISFLYLKDIPDDFLGYFPDFDVTSLLLLKRRHIHVMRNNLFGLNNTKEIELVGSIPSPLFNSRTPIPPHTHQFH